MNLPNKITVFRVCMIPVFLLFYLGPWFDFTAYYGDIFIFSFGLAGQMLALAVFGAAAASDALDGYIARHRGLVTNFGKLMDPLADKLLVSAALIAMVQTGTLPAWVVVLLISREFFISGFRQLALERDIVLAASATAKWKTATQMVMIIYLLLPLAEPFRQLPAVRALDWVLITASVALSLLSAVEYVHKNKERLGI